MIRVHWPSVIAFTCLGVMFDIGFLMVSAGWLFLIDDRLAPAIAYGLEGASAMGVATYMTSRRLGRR